MAIWYILWPLTTVVVIWYCFPVLVYVLCQEKSGNPGACIRGKIDGFIGGNSFLSKKLMCHQGDQNAQFFAFLVIVYTGLFKKIQKLRKILRYFFPL
jgi:hypothetical protein